jgi:hypothetical protein
MTHSKNRLAGKVMTMKDKDGKAASYSYCDIYRDVRIVETECFCHEN